MQNLSQELQDYLNGICCTATPVATPPTIEYTNTQEDMNAGNPVNICPTTLTGDATITVTVSPSLPAGLTLDSATGCITGTPTSAISSTAFTFTATNTFGSDTDIVNVTINPVLGKITITGGGFADAAAAEAYVASAKLSPTYTNFSYDAVNDIARWDEPINTVYGGSFMNTPDVLATAVFSDTQGHIVTLGGFNNLTSNHTFADGITFGNDSFAVNTGNNTFGNNCIFKFACFGDSSGINTFGTNAYFEDANFTNATGTYNFGNGVIFDNISNFHFSNANGATVNFGNIANVISGARLFDNSQNCIINFNGNIGATSGADFTDQAWILPTANNLTINARVSDKTSNAGGIEGDLANSINLGLTVNFIL